MQVMVGVQHVQKLVVFGAVLLISGLTANETRQLCNGEVTGVELPGGDDVCVLEPNKTTSTSLRSTSIVQHREDALLRRGNNTVWLDVRMITSSSQELDRAFALNVFSGTFLFLTNVHTPCLGTTRDNISNLATVQLLLKGDCDCQPEAHVPLITPTPSPSADNISVFFGVNRRIYQLCDGEITGVQFNYSGEYIICRLDQEANSSGSSVSKKVQNDEVLNFKNETSRLNVRMIDNSTWGLDPAFALQLYNQTVLYIAHKHCVINDTINIINERDEHSPVEFLLAEKDSCSCGSGSATPSSIAATTASPVSSTPYATISPTELPTDPPRAAGVVLIVASASATTVIIIVVVLAILCLVFKTQSLLRKSTRQPEMSRVELAPANGIACKAAPQSNDSIDPGWGKSLACSPQTSFKTMNPNDCWQVP